MLVFSEEVEEESLAWMTSGEPGVPLGVSSTGVDCKCWRVVWMSLRLSSRD